MKSLLSIFLAVALISGCSENEPAMTGADQLSADYATVSAKKFSSAGEAEYEVTIVNMSHSQPFSPGVVVTHDGTANVFEAGSPASEGIRLIAENGDPSTAVAAQTGAAGVADVVATTAPVHRKKGPGPDKLTTYVTASGEAHYLSMAVMLICTNDGFVGLNSVELPSGPETAVYFPNAYDAGTEANDELNTSIVDPCGVIGPVSVAPDDSNDRTATSDVIQMHPGIAGDADLDADAHNWRNKVARVTVKRIR